MLGVELSERAICAIALLSFVNFVQSRFEVGLHIVVRILYVLLLTALSDDPLFLITGGVLIIIAEIDRREYRIPDIFTKSAIWALIILFRTDVQLLLIVTAWISAMYLLTYFLPEAFGRGDVKLIAVLLLENGYFQSANHGHFLITLVGLASLLALPGLIARKVGSSMSPYPFAPSIAASWLLISVLSAG